MSASCRPAHLRAASRGERTPAMIRYSSDQDNAGIAWTAALAAVLASILLVRWLAHVSALALAGLAAAVVMALFVSWVVFRSKKPERCDGTGYAFILRNGLSPAIGRPPVTWRDRSARRMARSVPPPGMVTDATADPARAALSAVLADAPQDVSASSAAP